jgi:AhpC/TSA family
MSGKRSVRFLTVLVCLAAATTVGRGASTATSGPQLLDLSGHEVNPLTDGGKKATVFVFTRTDCPISNRYAPRLHKLYQKYSSQGVKFWLVYVDPHQGPAAIEKHMREFSYRCGALRDPKHELVKLTGAKVTPEAAVFAPSSSGPKMVYCGRIDDQYVDFGVTRPAPTTHDLANVLEELVEGKTVQPRTTRAVGCFISDLK